MLLTESSVYRPAPRLSSGKWHAGVRHRHRCPRCGRLGVDANHELPVAFAVTPASYGEQPVAQLLLDQLQGRHPDLLQQCQRLSADKGYDDSKLIERLWDQHQNKPIIDIRNCWKDSDAEEDGVRTSWCTVRRT